MALVTLPHPEAEFENGPGHTADGQAVWENMVALRDALNGGLDTANLSAALLGLVFRPGDLKVTAKSAVDSGWLLCDGAAVSRTTYAGLFAAIGTTRGAGDGSTTFNVPDLRGRTLIGLGTHADVNAMNDTDGLAVASRTPRHTHTNGAHAHGLNDHHHYVTWPVGQFAGTLVVWNPDNASLDGIGAAPGTTGSSVAFSGGVLSGQLASVLSSTVSATSGLYQGATSGPNPVTTTDTGGVATSSASIPAYGVVNVWIRT